MGIMGNQEQRPNSIWMTVLTGLQAGKRTSARNSPGVLRQVCPEFNDRPSQLQTACQLPVRMSRPTGRRCLLTAALGTERLEPSSF